MARVLDGDTAVSAAKSSTLQRPAADFHRSPEAGTTSSVIRSSVQTRYAKLAKWMAATDGAVVLVAFLSSYFLRFPSSALPWEYAALTFAAPVIWVLIFQAHKLYAPQHLSAWEEFRRVMSATGLGVVVLIMASYWTKGELSRLWLGFGWTFAMLLLLVERRAWRLYIAKLRTKGDLAYRTLIIGSNQEADRLGRLLTAEHGFIPVGYIGPEGSVAATDGLPVFPDLDDVVQAVDELRVECLFVASSAVTTAAMTQVLRSAARCGVEIRLSANLPEILSSRLTVQPYGDVMALSLAPARLSSGQVAVKRLFDIVAASVALIIFSPVMLVVAAAVTVTSRGPVFYRQERVSKHGRTFTMYKFRTMVSSADQILAELEEDPNVPFFKLGSVDPRVTAVGRWIRRFSIDELPQLLNVLKGEMSLVGPRPLPSEQVAANLELLEPRHQVPAGVTGWWQIKGRSDVAPDEAVRMDLFYIENWSLALDLFILLKTMGAVVARRGAY